MSNPGQICVVILNWNNSELTLRCLESLRTGSDSELIDIVLVDNGSYDIEEVKSLFLLHTNHLIRNEKNYGFSGGYNVGISYALSNNYDWIMILNNDATSNASDIIKMCQVAISTGQRNAYSPLIIDEDSKDIWFAGGLYDEQLNRPIHVRSLQTSEAFETDYLTGCSILAHQSIWREVGLFDPKYFLVFEDSDWSLRARQTGVGLVVLPSISILHKPSSTFKKNTQNISTFFFVRNGIHFNRKWYGLREATRFAMRYVAKNSISEILRFRFDYRVGFARLCGTACAILKIMNGVPRIFQSYIR